MRFKRELLLERDPEKCVAVFREIARPNKNLAANQESFAC